MCNGRAEILNTQIGRRLQVPAEFRVTGVTITKALGHDKAACIELAYTCKLLINHATSY